MKKKGFTLIELLVVIAIIALLMGILMPTLAMVRKMAQRALCATNLSGLYKAMQTYAHQYKDDYPKAGGKLKLSGGSLQDYEWQPTRDWLGATEDIAFVGPSGTGSKRRASIGASLFLLIKYADVGPKSYICRGDSEATVFSLSLFPGATIDDLRLAWDFGTVAANTTGLPPAQYYSYAYQMPIGTVGAAYYAPNPTRQPDLAIMADRNPYLGISTDATVLNYQYTGGSNEEVEKWGNTPNHNLEGQNVLYNNSSVTFQSKPYCGINNDNIYTMDTVSGVPQSGTIPTQPPKRVYNFSFLPKNGDDSVLLNEGVNRGGVQ